MYYADNSASLFKINWIAIASYAGSLAVSIAIWAGLFLAIHRLVR
jgi:hypothetical protein